MALVVLKRKFRIRRLDDTLASFGTARVRYRTLIGALAAGLGHGLLVRTGKYQPGHENAVKPRPTAVVDDIALAADWIIDHTV